MKHPLFVIVLLLGGLIAGCASVASGESQAVTGDTGSVALEQETAQPTDTVELEEANAVGRSVAAPAPNPTPEPSASASQSTPTDPPTSAPTSIPVPSPSPAPSATPTDTPEATTAAVPTSPPPTTPEDSVGQAELVGRGLEVYKEQYCGICHQFSVADTGGLFGPTHDGIGTIADQRVQAPDYTGSATTGAEYIRESLLDPKAYLVPGFETTSHHMPAYTHLDESDINALVQMLLQQR
jgi:mono/diheme cytochrome c family protein